MNRDGSIADPGQIASAMKKMQEDPLFLIKKEEAKHQKALSDNPLVRERIRQMLRAENQLSQTKSEYSDNRSNSYRDTIKSESRGGRRDSPPRSHLRDRDHRSSSRRYDYDDRRRRPDEHSRSPSRERRRDRSPPHHGRPTDREFRRHR